MQFLQILLFLALFFLGAMMFTPFKIQINIMLLPIFCAKQKNNKILISPFGARHSFLLSGIAIAPWAALMPYVKEHLQLNDLCYALVLLCFGVGSVTGMPITGYLVRKFGVKKILLISFVGLYLCVLGVSLPFLNLPFTVIFVFLWGAFLGINEVANNIHGTYFEDLLKTHLLSGFHAFQTVGCLITALIYPVFLSLGFAPYQISIALCLLGLFSSFSLSPYLQETHGIRLANKNDRASENTSFTPLSQYQIILAGIACMIMYLCEGMVYDWSGVYLNIKCSVPIEIASIGYVVFQFCVAVLRFVGDRLVNTIGSLRLIVIGSFIAFIALFMVALNDNPVIVILAFALCGLSLANVVPILFSDVAKRCGKNKARAISLVGTLGYSGVLFGPALLGLIATFVSLSAIYAFTACCMVILTICSFKVLAKVKANK